MKADEIEANVAKTEEGCWLWQGAKNGAGYPMARIEGELSYVHRVVYSHHHGPIGSGEQVVRTCDRRLCVAPEHVIIRGKSELEDRFWSKVDVGGPDECWEWQAAVHHARPQPIFWFEGETISARIVAYYLDRGAFPAPHSYVLPVRCMDPLCVNPAHLLNCGTNDRLWYQDQVSARGWEAEKAKCEYEIERLERLEKQHDAERARLLGRETSDLSPDDLRALTGSSDKTKQMERLKKIAPWRFTDDLYEL